MNHYLAAGGLLLILVVFSLITAAFIVSNLDVAAEQANQKVEQQKKDCLTAGNTVIDYHGGSLVFGGPSWACERRQ